MEPGLSQSSMELRRGLLRYNGEEILRRMRESGLSDPVGLIIDATDPMGKSITYSAVQAEGVPKHEIPEILARLSRNESIPTFLMVLTLETAKRVLVATSESAESNLSAPRRAGTAWVVIIAGGGNSYAQVPFHE